MATSPNQPTSTALPACPFCCRQFKSLGNHISKCKERNGRDYSSYLSQKTLEKKAKTTSSRRSCPRCHKRFLRLDTHLRNNPFCKPVSQDEMLYSSPSAPDQTTSSTTNSLSQPPDISSHSVPPVQMSEDPVEASPSKPPLKLPSTKEHWQEADSFFLEMLIPAVQ